MDTGKWGMTYSYFSSPAHISEANFYWTPGALQEKCPRKRKVFRFWLKKKSKTTDWTGTFVRQQKAFKVDFKFYMFADVMHQFYLVQFYFLLWPWRYNSLDCGEPAKLSILQCFSSSEHFHIKAGKQVCWILLPFLCGRMKGATEKSRERKGGVHRPIRHPARGLGTWPPTARSPDCQNNNAQCKAHNTLMLFYVFGQYMDVLICK